MRCLLLLLALSTPVVAQDAKGADDRAKAVLAQIDGEIRLSGLKQPVELVRDKWGVPHIFARNTHDLFFAQGFVAAQDRLFQIDFWRRQGTGELAEVLGPSAVDADAFARLMRYRGDMDAEWRSYSPDTREIAVAFTSGINACIDHMGDRLPIEFTMLGYRPKHWRPEDILGRSSGIYMSQNFRNEIERLKLIQIVGLEKAQWLAPVDPAHEYKLHLSADEVRHFPANVLRGYEALTKSLSFTPPKTESNNWVVSGARSQSGKPLLASDPHRAIALPALRYVVHLHAPGWNVIGAGEPGLPGVALGHNEDIAWGITIVGVDQADIYVETTDPENPRYYQAGSEYASMKEVKESINVKGHAKPTEVTLRYTRHGPVLYQDPKHHRAYALRWTGSDPGGAAYLGGLAVARARNQQEFLKALQSWKTPGLNFVYADVAGNIGWVAAARMPIRAAAKNGHDGLLPVPGTGFDWSGHLSVPDYPQRFNPAEGFIATANHNVLPKGYDHPLGYEFAPPYRFDRLHNLLKSRPKWELNDFRALQQDSVSLPALSLVKLLLDAGVPEHAEAARVFEKWDGHMAVDSAAGSLYALWLKELTDDFLGQHVDKKNLKTLTALSGVPVIIKALEDADPRWLGKDAPAARQKLLRESFVRAVAKWQQLPDEQRQRWGALHTVTFQHPVSKAFNVGPFERPGEANTPNNTRYDDKFKQIHGATYRQLFDLADWDRALATSAPGQSGQPGSPHYDDLAAMWARGEYFPLVYTRTKVDEMAQNRLRLQP